jgi:protein-disulfide isomerase
MRRLIAIPLLALLATLGYAQNTARPAHGPSIDSPAKAALPTEETVNSFMKQTFAYDPKVHWKVLDIRESEVPGVAEVTISIGSDGPGDQNMRLYVLPGEKWAISGDMIPFGAAPFEPMRKKLQERATGPSQGPANAAFTIVEFSDLQCPACRATQPVIDRLLQDVPNVHFVFQNFPLAMHPWAFKAATYVDCVGRNNNPAIWKFIHQVFDNQQEITPENADAKLKTIAGEAGVNADQIAACAAQPATEERVRLSQALGVSVNVESTPTLFINGRKVSNVLSIPYETLKALVQSTSK